MAQISQNVIDRFWTKVDKTPGQGTKGDCWIWTGAISKSTGYGKVSLGHGKTVDAHRFVCIYIHLFEMNGLDARHFCHFRSCVRPSHLGKGTRKDNMQDCVKAGRTARGGGNAHGEKNGMAILTPDQVQEIRRRCKSEHQKAVAAAFGVSKHCVFDIINGRTWKHLDEKLSTH